MTAGKRRCATYLPRCLDSFPNAEEDNGEDEEEAKSQLPTDRAQLVQPWRAVDLQHLTTTSRKHGMVGPQEENPVPRDTMKGRRGKERELRLQKDSFYRKRKE